MMILFVYMLCWCMILCYMNPIGLSCVCVIMVLTVLMLMEIESEDNDDFGDIEVMVVVEVNMMIVVVVVDDEVMEMIHVMINVLVILILIQMLNILDIMKIIICRKCCWKCRHMIFLYRTNLPTPQLPDSSNENESEPEPPAKLAPHAAIFTDFIPVVLIMDLLFL
eukprot:508798_1